ncbi:hypothetical protein CUMW_218250 [Citrus unshiu]|uniref:TPX2 C-terminal domain-containing protein n=1 Tax=Citrus unshiu TaxID=55188 RepID=A0A2H5QCY1_CITUN|nr:hypothetical protein CUMW_218250 [Citrus unshiu]
MLIFNYPSGDCGLENGADEGETDFVHLSKHSDHLYDFHVVDEVLNDFVVEANEKDIEVVNPLLSQFLKNNASHRFRRSMTTHSQSEVDHQAFFESSARSSPELSFDSQQHLEFESVSLSSILDQGSVSFGKYSTEALAWEKRSVFPHDRFQEELDKFKNPGLVAQKKAYFEEYYKKLRAIKGLQAQQQEFTQRDACQVAQSSTTDVNSTVSKDENNVSQIPISDNSTITSLNSSPGGTVCDSGQDTEAQWCKNSLSTVKDMKNITSLFSSTIKAKHSTKRTSSSQNSPSGSMKTASKKSLVSSSVSHKTNQPKKQVPGLQAKGIVASLRNKTDLESSGTAKNAIKESEKPKPTHRKITQKTDNSLLPIKKSGPKAASKTKRQTTKVCPTATVPDSLSAKGNQVSSFSSVRAHLMKQSKISPGLAGKLPPRLPVPAQSAKIVSSSSSIRDHLMKPSTTSVGLAGKLLTRSSVPVQCAKPVSSTSSTRSPVKPSTTSEGLAGKLPTRLPSISKDKASTGGLRNLGKRSANLSSPSKSSQIVGAQLGHRSLVQGGKQKEGKEKEILELGRDPKALSSTGPRRDPKPPSSMVSNNFKTLHEKRVPKIAPWQSGDEKRG